MLTRLLLCRQATSFILIFSIGNEALLMRIDPEEYVPFISDVSLYYKSTGVFFLYDDLSEIYSTYTSIAIYFKQFSNRGVFCQAFRYSRMKEKSDYYLSLNVQSLFVVFLTKPTSFDNFRAATELHDMSYHTWLIVFADEAIDADCHEPQGNPFNLVFNSRMIVRCAGYEEIRKWYSLFENRTEVLDLAKWSKKLGISYKNKNYYESRFDLSGKSLRIATHSRKTTLMNGKMTGFLEELLRELRNFMNFNVTRAREEDAFGKWDSERQNWSGLIGLLTERKVDLVVAPVTISKFRMDFVDFTRPLLLSANRIYVKQPGGARVQWSAYFRAFTVASWSSIALLIIVASLLSTFIRVIIRESKVFRISLHYLLENFIRTWGIYCQQGLPEFPAATPLRLAYFTMLLLTVIIWAIYSASITSYLTVLTPSLPFSDTDGFVRDGSYRLIVLQNSSDYDLISSGNDPVLAPLRPLLRHPDDLPTNPYDGFQQVCEERVGFYTSQSALDGVSAYIPCTLTYIETGQFECLAMALRKRSPYITSINYNLRKLEDNGVMRKLKNWYFRKLDNPVDAGHSPIGLWGVAPLLAIFAGGFGLSCLFLLIEQLCYCAWKTKREFIFK